MRTAFVVLATALTAAACQGTTLPGGADSGLDSGAPYMDAVEVCGAATTAEACRDATSGDWDCAPVLSAECAADPYDVDTDWRFDDCIPSNVTCTQYTVWLATDEGCRAFDACTAPASDYPSCDPDVECP